MKKFLKKLGKGIWNGIKILIILVLLAILILGIYFYAKYAKPILALKAKAESIAAESKREDFASALTSIVYDANGEKIVSLRSGRDAHYLCYEELTEYAKDVILVTEDKKFYSHEGVDLLANLRALYHLVKNKGKITQGGSTITQQLARTIYLTNEVSYERKLVEVFLAWELEEIYSKEDILEFYFNNIYFANGYYGIQAAANGYFGKSVKDLSLSETAFLCAIPNNPSLYDPYLRKEKTLERRDRMLVQMLEDGEISQQEYDAAINEEIVLGKNSVSRHNYVETYVYYCAVRALMQADGFTFRTVFSGEEAREKYEEEYEASYEYWQKKMYQSGYRVYTSIDLSVQERLQEAVNQELEGFTEVGEDGIYELQSSAVCIDNDSGRVLAIVGGREQEYAGYTLNRAYQSFRQPGSSIKPLIVYAPWFERGLTPEDIVLDEKFEGGPTNAGSYLGEITVRTAVAKSQNTVAWKLFTKLTPEVGLSYLNKMRFRKIVETDYVPAASLGGLTYGVSALEMASAFAALENDGIYRVPTCIVRITDSDGKEIVGDRVEEIVVYKKEAARMMTDTLCEVMKTGTGRKKNLDTAIAAGKTGTADDKKDGWFIGYTTYYTTSVWVGYDMPKKVSDLSGNTYPLAIWKRFMDEMHEDLPVQEFTPYKKQEQTEPTLSPSATPIPTPEPTKTPTVTPEPTNTDGNQYQVSPVPPKKDKDEEDPTKDPR